MPSSQAVPTTQRLTDRFKNICKSRFTGQLVIQSHSQRWTFYLSESHLIWADGGAHPKRRWKRLFERFCRDLRLETISPRNSDELEHDRYHVLNILLKRKLVTREQVTQILEKAIAEILFDILQEETWASLEYRQRSTSTHFLWESGIKVPIARIAVARSLQNAKTAWNAWCDRGLESVSPNLAPATQPHISPASPNYKTLNALARKKRTLREIAVHSNRDEFDIARRLFPYLRQGEIKLIKVADIPSKKIAAQKKAAAEVEPKQERRQFAQSHEALDTTLRNLKKARATGKLECTDGYERWQFFFRSGNLLCVSGGNDRSRRWYRALRQYGQDFYEAKLPRSFARGPWEYHLLARGLSEEQLDPVRARKILGCCVREVLFTVLCRQGVKHQWFALEPPEIAAGLTLDIEKVLTWVQPLLKRKQALKLPPFCPNSSPVLRKPVGRDTTIGMSRLLIGQYSFWDIALEKDRSVIEVARSVLPLVGQGAIKLRSIPDLVPPIVPNPIVPKSPISSVERDRPAAPLIACIDDSPKVCEAMKTIVTDAGYRFLAIEDSVRAIPILLDRQPDLILLDLVMPIASGYEVCAQIRRISRFKETPIAIVTGNDGAVDRFRAKITGASDFIGKPIKRQLLLRLLDKYVPIQHEVRSR
ncbi:MAG: response regulator [Cyanobacteriota bacterium]|nr:response regulator [Cyanobacteriota bacterium]